MLSSSIVSVLMQIRTYFQMPMLGRSASPMHGSDTTICITIKQISHAACCQSRHGVDMQVCAGLSATWTASMHRRLTQAPFATLCLRKTSETATVQVQHFCTSTHAYMHRSQYNPRRAKPLGPGATRACARRPRTSWQVWARRAKSPPMSSGFLRSSATRVSSSTNLCGSRMPPFLLPSA